ncbi:MAG: hypothetical protein LCH67_01300 [Bacteroidetes bacterium]|nr:hypothetical protein [Bacteroidota bacterium]
MVWLILISCKKPGPDPKLNCRITLTASNRGSKASVFYDGDSIMKKSSHFE